MLAISKLEADGWRFGLSSGVADTLDDEELVLTELADALPHPRFLLGYAKRCFHIVAKVNDSDRSR
jgi:hypothetical protein